MAASQLIQVDEDGREHLEVLVSSRLQIGFAYADLTRELLKNKCRL